MSLIVIERSSRVELAYNIDDATAISEAFFRGGQLEDLEYVHGDVDIRIYYAAKKMENMCGGFPNWLKQKDAPLEDILAAEAKYNIWAKIMRSRTVTHAWEYAEQLTSIFESALVEDILFIFQIIESDWWSIFTPDTYKQKCNACDRARYLAHKKYYYRIVLAHNKKLGIFVVCPSVLITKRLSFLIENIF